MFFTPTLKSDWFYVHKTAQCLMVILLVAMLVMPILHQPPKAEAIDPATLTITFTVITIIIAGAAVAVNWWVNKPNPCPAGCQVKVKDPDSHTINCPNGGPDDGCDDGS